LNENTYEILDCFHEYLPAEWEVIGKSFDAYLEKLIDLKGKILARVNQGNLR
jgi:hypothetical protein